METTDNNRNLHIYSVITAFGYSKTDAVWAVFVFKWKSIRDCARHLNVSHTTIRKILSGDIKSGDVSNRLFSELGINNPWV